MKPTAGALPFVTEASLHGGFVRCGSLGLSAIDIRQRQFYCCE